MMQNNNIRFMARTTNRTTLTTVKTDLIGMVADITDGNGCDDDRVETLITGSNGTTLTIHESLDNLADIIDVIDKSDTIRIIGTIVKMIDDVLAVQSS